MSSTNDSLKTKCLEIARLKEVANGLARTGDFKSAEQLLLSTIELIPSISVKPKIEALLRSNLSFVFLQQNKFGDAKQAAEDTIRLHPTWIKGCLRWVEVFVKEGREAQEAQAAQKPHSNSKSQPLTIRLQENIDKLTNGIKHVTASAACPSCQVDQVDQMQLLESCKLATVNDPKDVQRAKDLLERFRNELYMLLLSSSDTTASSSSSLSPNVQKFLDWMDQENPHGIRGLTIQEQTPTNRSVSSDKTLYDQSIVLSIPVFLFYPLFVEYSDCCYSTGTNRKK